MKGKYIVLYFGLLSVLFLACCKDKIQKPIVEEPSKWEMIPGDYKVYDTLGGYLYDMEIKYERKVNSQNEEYDWFKFLNFDNEFIFDKSQYSKPNNYYGSQLYVELGNHDTLFDSNGNKWKFFGVLAEGYNLFHNDTIFLKFKKTNINYYLQDLVPYYECVCKQIAVKQH